MSTSYLAAGVDVSKQHLDLAFAGDHHRKTIRFANDPAGRMALAKRCRQGSIACVAVEATGGYERPLVQALHHAGVPVAVVQPGLVRHHARAKRVLAKTDAIDASVIADYARQHRPRLTPPISQNQLKIRAYSDRRDQLVQDRVREQGRLEACDCDAIAPQLRDSIERLTQAIDQLEADLDRLVQADPQLARRHQTLRSVTGVGMVCANVLTVYLPELGHANRQQIAALAGLAPYNHDSGKCRGKRRVFAGRARVREALYMSALSAIQYHPKLKAHYQHLLAKGKLKKVAQCACARKLLIQLNSMIAEQTRNNAANPINASGGKAVGA